MRPITLKIAAGATEAIPINGRYVRNGDLSATVTVQDQASGDFAILAAGDAVQFESAYQRLLISHNEATEQTIVLTFGFGQILTARTVGTVSVDGTVNIQGTVDVVDGAKSTTQAGAAYMANIGISGVSTQYAHVQLLNPALSTINVIISKIGLRTTGGASVGIFSYDVALVTASGAPHPKLFALPLAVSQAQPRQASLGSPLGGGSPGIAGALFSLTMAAGAFEIIELKEPIILPPGMGLLINNFTVAGDIGAYIEFVEEAT